METRSKTRGIPVSTANQYVLTNPDARSSADPEDIGLATLMDDGAGAAVGGSRPEVGVTT